MLEPGDLKPVLLLSPCYSVSPFSSLPVVVCCHKVDLEQTQLHLTFTDGPGPLIDLHWWTRACNWRPVGQAGEAQLGHGPHRQRVLCWTLGCIFSLSIWDSSASELTSERLVVCVGTAGAPAAPNVPVRAVGPLGVGGMSWGWQMVFPLQLDLICQILETSWRKHNLHPWVLHLYASISRSFVMVCKEPNSDCCLFQQILFGTHQLKAVFTSPDTIYLRSVLSV